MYYRNPDYRQDLKDVSEAIGSVAVLEGCSVLVTGASGLIGSFLVDCLMFCNNELKCQIEVYAMGRDLVSLERRFESHRLSRCLHIVQHDVTVPLNRKQRFDYIIHAASPAYPQAFVTNPVGTIIGNIWGLYHLLEHLRRSDGKRLLFVSSGEVYGQCSPEAEAFDETCYGYVDITDPRSCYPSAKRLGETLCVSYTAQYDVDTVIARLCHTYGPTALRKDNRVSSQFLYDAIAGKELVMKSPGTQLRSYCYVADCASAILTILLRGRSGNAYNVANADSIVTIRDMAYMIADICGTRVVYEQSSDRERSGFNKMMNAVLDTKKLEGLGWTGRYDMRTGLSRTVAIMKQVCR